MEINLRQMLEEIRELEKTVAAQLKKTEIDVRYSVAGHKVTFAREVRRRHAQFKRGSLRFLRESSIPALLVAPVIYAVLIPTVLMDIFVSLYQMICFPVYRIPKIKRSDYIVFDRHRLGYLNWIERMNCDYCAYVNGVIAYTRELAGRTEQYFCPIRHALAVKGLHPRHANFVPFGDAEHYRAQLETLRQQIRRADVPPPPAPPETTACGEPRQ